MKDAELLAEIRDRSGRPEAGQLLFAEASLLVLGTQRTEQHQRESMTGRIRQHFGTDEDGAAFGP